MKNKWILTLVIIVMLAYQAWRVFDYMSTSFMGMDENTSFFVSIAFLTFTEIGLLVWLHVAQPGSTTSKQESVSGAMIWVDFAGSMILGLADLAKHNTLYQIDLSRLDPILFIAPWLIVVLNVAAWIIFETNDSGKKLEKAERQLTHAEHELEIQARLDAIEELNANRKGLSRQLTPFYVRDIKDRVTGRAILKFAKEGEKLSLPEYTTQTTGSPSEKDTPSLIKRTMEKIGLSQPSSSNGNGVGEAATNQPAVKVSANGNGHKDEPLDPTSPPKP